MTPEERAERLLAAAAAVKKPGAVVVAIDGMSASGKTTLAEAVQRRVSCSVVHMDDFFLPPSLRTPERLGEPGGNVHRERFAEEVLPFLHGDKPFSYRVFSCRAMDYAGERTVVPGNILLVEGAYCLHPAFGDYADLKVFSEISPEEQEKRIRENRGERAEDFFHRWIPMENAYFQAFGVREKADIIL